MHARWQTEFKRRQVLQLNRCTEGLVVSSSRLHSSRNFVIHPLSRRLIQQTELDTFQRLAAEGTDVCQRTDVVWNTVLRASCVVAVLARDGLKQQC